MNRFQTPTAPARPSLPPCRPGALPGRAQCRAEPARQHTAPRPDQTRTAPTQPSRRNAIKATLLLVLSISIAILLFTFRWFWLLLVAGCAVWVVLGLLAFIWKAIYDTLQEGDPP